MKHKLLLIYTGGTIGMIRDYKTKSLSPLEFTNIYDKIPEIRQLNCEITSLSFKNPIDSSNISPTHWIYLASLIKENYSKYASFIILHGTDTMSFTASALSFMLEGLQKPVILTGSQLPIGDLRTDAKENLITSMYIATQRENNLPILREVCVYFEYKLYRGNRTTKLSAEQFDAFISPNYPFLMESGVHLKINKNSLYRSDIHKLKINRTFSKDVVILKLFPGITQEVIHATLNIPNLKGVVLETFGSGNAPTDSSFLELIKKAIQKGIVIINVTQCLMGEVFQGKYNTSLILKEIGVIGSRDMTIESALTKMMLALGNTKDKMQFKEYFMANIRGEITR